MNKDQFRLELKSLDGGILKIDCQMYDVVWSNQDLSCCMIVILGDETDPKIQTLQDGSVIEHPQREVLARYFGIREYSSKRLIREEIN